MQKIANIDKKIPVTVRVTGYLRGIKVLNLGGSDWNTVSDNGGEAAL